MEAPVILQPVPNQVVNEGAAYGPFDLQEYIKAPDGSDVRFEAEVEGGGGLPQGMICTYDGILTGIPAKGTEGNYAITLTVSNDAGSVTATFYMLIKPVALRETSAKYADELKQQVWEAIENNQPIPDLSEILGRDITPSEIYYLLERWATLTIYDAYNLEAPGEKHEIHLEGSSPHYVTYDRGCCLVAAPKDLYSHERTLADAIVTAQAIAREAVKRNWVVELVGFGKLTRAAWVEIQHLSEATNQKIDVLNFSPTDNDIKLYQESARSGPSTRNE